MTCHPWAASCALQDGPPPSAPGPPGPPASGHQKRCGSLPFSPPPPPCRQMAVARLQRRTNSTSEDIGVPASLLVAFLAGCGNVLLTNPIWTVATNMQVGLWFPRNVPSTNWYDLGQRGMFL